MPLHMPHMTESKETRDREYVSFHLGEDEYCVDIQTVMEIRGGAQITRLPHVPPFVRGVINLRGTVLPIVDLSLRLGLGETDTNGRHVIMVLQTEGTPFGILVDAVSDILTIPEEMLQPAPSAESDPNFRLIGYVASLDGRTIRHIDAANLVPATGSLAA